MNDVDAFILQVAEELKRLKEEALNLDSAESGEALKDETTVILTPEDIVGMRFRPSRSKEGYDMDEVDDFLDEIVAEFRARVRSNSDRRSSLEDAGS